MTEAKFRLGCINDVAKWDEGVAQTIETELKSCVEKATNVSWDEFEHAYTLVHMSGHFGPFEKNPDDLDDPMTVSRAEEIVSSAVENCRFKDYQYVDFEYETISICPSCSSQSISVKTSGDIFSCTCNNCNSDFDMPNELPNMILKGSQIRDELFATWFKIYGK